MAREKSDLPARRTQTLVRAALVDLIEQKGFDAITVSELAERAMVSRATFYRYYQDKYELVERIFAEATLALAETGSSGGKQHPPQIWVNFLEHFADNKRLYRALLGSNGSPWFVEKMSSFAREMLEEHVPAWQVGTHGKKSGVNVLTQKLVAALFVETISWWLEQDIPYRPREFSERCASLVTAILKDVSAWHPPGA